MVLASSHVTIFRNTMPRRHQVGIRAIFDPLFVMANHRAHVR